MVMVTFSSRARTLGECAHSSFPACAFYLKRRLARAHEFRSLGQDQSTVAQQAETTVTERSLTSRV